MRGLQLGMTSLSLQYKAGPQFAAAAAAAAAVAVAVAVAAVAVAVAAVAAVAAAAAAVAVAAAVVPTEAAVAVAAAAAVDSQPEVDSMTEGQTFEILRAADAPARATSLYHRQYFT